MSIEVDICVLLRKVLYMWLENLKKAKEKAGNPSYHEIAEKACCCPKTVSRIFKGETDFPDTCTLERIAEALGTNLNKILEGTDTSVGNIALLEEQIATLTAEVERLTNLVKSLEAELMHKDEIIVLKDEIINIYRKQIE